MSHYSYVEDRLLKYVERQVILNSKPVRVCPHIAIHPSKIVQDLRILCEPCSTVFTIQLRDISS